MCSPCTHTHSLTQTAHLVQQVQQSEFIASIDLIIEPRKLWLIDIQIQNRNCHKSGNSRLATGAIATCGQTNQKHVRYTHAILANKFVCLFCLAPLLGRTYDKSATSFSPVQRFVSSTRAQHPQSCPLPRRSRRCRRRRSIWSLISIVFGFLFSLFTQEISASKHFAAIVNI